GSKFQDGGKGVHFEGNGLEEGGAESVVRDRHWTMNDRLTPDQETIHVLLYGLRSGCLAPLCHVVHELHGNARRFALPEKLVDLAVISSRRGGESVTLDRIEDEQFDAMVLAARTHHLVGKKTGQTLDVIQPLFRQDIL